MRASASAVNQLRNTVTVVGVVDGEVLVGVRNAVGGDERTEVVGNNGGVVVGQAWRRIVVTGLLTLDRSWGCESSDGKEAGDNGKAAHIDDGVGDCKLALKCSRD